MTTQNPITNEEIEYDEAFEIINNSSLKGKGSEPSCFIDYTDDDTPSAELGWNTPKDARWFFFTNIAIALRKKDAEIKELKRLLEEEYKKGIKDGADGVKAQLSMLNKSQKDEMNINRRKRQNERLKQIEFSRIEVRT